MSQLIIIPTHSGDRTNICAGFRLLSKSAFLQGLKDHTIGGQFRCGYLDGTYTYLLKHMPLNIFEQEFGENHDISKRDIEKYFSADVKKKYGGKAVKITNLEVGKMYETIDKKFIFLGKIIYEYHVEDYAHVQQLRKYEVTSGYLVINNETNEYKYVTDFYGSEKTIRIIDTNDTNFQIPESKVLEFIGNRGYKVTFL